MTLQRIDGDEGRVRWRRTRYGASYVHDTHRHEEIILLSEFEYTID